MFYQGLHTIELFVRILKAIHSTLVIYFTAYVTLIFKSVTRKWNLHFPDLELITRKWNFRFPDLELITRKWNFQKKNFELPDSTK